MPFTLAHPAVTLPLRRRLWFPGLVAGSVAPDVGYYVAFAPDGTHSLLGLPATLMIAAGLLPIAVLAQRPLLALLGRTAATLPRPDPVRLALALLVGILTHLAWDSFTQTDGFAVQHWEALRHSVIGPHRVYNVTGHLSSAIGLLILARYSHRWYRTAQPTPPIRGRTWILTGLAVAAVIGALLAAFDPVIRISLYDCIRHLLISALRCTTIAFALYSALYLLIPGRRRDRTPA
ncbi:DUF4184 family protein [Nocardia jejuensis]|uniref:DUF4184 family protein n=1 Tax=Nocardia jejuensis TaxID=328049 RepID=UPI00082A6E47|nr:DUF4184 family protein [Nocardia jejuensis]